MAFELTDLLVEAYRRLGQFNESGVTSGTAATTIIDSSLAGKGADDDWIDGAVFMTYTTDAAAPLGQFQVVTDYADATGTFTFATMTAATGAGDRYGYVSQLYPLQTIIGLANSALQSLGDIPLVDTTTLDTAASQTEYTYSVAWKRNPPYRVDMQTKTTDADDNQWIELRDWEYIPATAAGTGLLILPQLPASRGLRIWYQGPHPAVQAYSDDIYAGFNPELITLMLVERALEWQNSRLQGGDPFLMQRWNDAKQQAAMAKQNYRVWKPIRRAGLMIVGSHVEEDRFSYPGPA